MKYRIKNENGTYFWHWTQIGPRFGATQKESPIYDSSQAAHIEMSKHYGFALCVLEPVEEVLDNDQATPDTD